MGDPIIERAVDYVLADEITHVRMGSKWMRKLTEGDPERLQSAQQFQDNIDALFNFEGFRTTKEEAPQVPLMLGGQQMDFDATLTISRETRLLAGFTDEEIDRLMKAAGAQRGLLSVGIALEPDITKRRKDSNAMQKMIAADRLARPDNFVLIRSRRMREIREEQGLDDRVLPFDEEALRVRLHGIFAGELQAMEAAGRTLFDFPDAPWEFQLDMARQVWDESRHSEIFMRLLQYMGAEPGDYPETEILWRCTQADDPAARVAGINRGLEGLACDVFDQLIRIAQKNGDQIIERAVDYVLADEITHVRMGSKWMRKLTEGDPERLRRAQEFQDSVDDLFNARGARKAIDDVEKDSQTITIAREARLLAGFTEEEIDRLIAAARASAAY